jgi:hypothetical protein
MKRNRGLSLLEIIFAVTLLAAIIPTLFGVFFANANLSRNLHMQAKMREAASDVKSFVKLADYNSVFNIVKNNELLAIEEVDDNGLLTRNFVKYAAMADKSKCNFVAKLEFARATSANSASNAIDEYSIPLQCKIYHVKSRGRNAVDAGTPPKHDMEFSLFFEKNR